MIHRSRALLHAALAAALLLAVLPALSPPPEAAERQRRVRPDILLVSVDTLRADRLSGYGYERPTSPAVDRLIEAGVRFDAARTVEPLTSPGTASMLTSLYPHEHGSTRNGLAVRQNLPSLPKLLSRLGYETAAFVANWTIKDKMSGFGEHFALYEEVLTRKRWFGLVASEATAEDVNEAAKEWIDEHAGSPDPFFAWVHYVEPHAPYEFQGEVAVRVGVERRDEATKSDRYDTEVAYVDHYVGELVDFVRSHRDLERETLVIFTSDHGESLGEHGYWGHGRRLYEPGLHIPLVLHWPERLEPGVVEAPASILDVPPTVLGLLGLEPHEAFRGYDWADVLEGRGEPEAGRSLWFQAHKGAVLDMQLDLRESKEARREGLMALAVVRDGTKEIAQVNRREHRLFDLDDDPRELDNLNGGDYQPSDELRGWIEHVEEALENFEDARPVDLSEEDMDRLRALGYIDG